MRRFDHEMGEHLDDLLDLSRADVTSRRPGRRAGGGRATSTRCKERILAIRDARRARAAAAAGPRQRDHGGVRLPPSKRIGDLRKLCEDAIERGELEERRDADYYVEYLRTSGAV